MMRNWCSLCYEEVDTDKNRNYSYQERLHARTVAYYRTGTYASCGLCVQPEGEARVILK
jgi:hypothetical protein